jgi:predicted kinase
MSQPVLIIVTGLPATGKTTLSRTLAKELNLPLLAKDDLKSIMFDGLGWSDLDWSVKVGVTAFRLMDYVIEEQLRHGNSLILECPFDPKWDNERFQRWQKAYGFTCVQVVCTAEREVIKQRFSERAPSRHPGRTEAANLEEFMRELTTRTLEPLDLDGPVITLDATDFSTVDEAALVRQIQATIG